MKWIKILFKKKSNIINNDNDNDKYRLSIHIDRERQEDIVNMNLFIKILNEQNIKFETFISEPTLITLHNKDRFIPFNICIEMKHKDTLKQIHNDIYGFYPL